MRSCVRGLCSRTRDLAKCVRLTRTMSGVHVRALNSRKGLTRIEFNTEGIVKFPTIFMLLLVVQSIAVRHQPRAFPCINLAVHPFDGAHMFGAIRVRASRGSQTNSNSRRSTVDSQTHALELSWRSILWFFSGCGFECVTV